MFDFQRHLTGHRAQIALTALGASLVTAFLISKWQQRRVQLQEHADGDEGLKLPPPPPAPTDEELAAAGLLDEGVSDYVKQCIHTMRTHPHLVSYSVFALQCVNNQHTLQNQQDSSAISEPPPQLFYRSDSKENPVLLPVDTIADKALFRAVHMHLRSIWPTVGRKICDLVKARGIRYSSINAETARFETQSKVCHVVILISTHPGTTTADDAHFASLDILELLKANEVEGAVVEWFEASIERL